MEYLLPSGVIINGMQRIVRSHKENIEWVVFSIVLTCSNNSNLLQPKINDEYCHRTTYIINNDVKGNVAFDK